MEKEQPSAPSERPAEPPERDDVHVAGSQVRCPFCHGRVDPERDDWSACQRCLARHHQPCWGEHGRCGSCGHDRALAAAPPTATAAPATRGPRTLTRLITTIAIVVLCALGVGAFRYQVDRAEAQARDARVKAAMAELQLFRETVRNEPRPGPGAPLELTSGGGPQRAVFERGVLVRDAQGRWAVAFRRPDGSLLSLLFGAPELRVVVSEGQVRIHDPRFARPVRVLDVLDHAGHLVEVGAQDRFGPLPDPYALQRTLRELEKAPVEDLDLGATLERHRR